ncbi:GNAT family N-acetyltransferase [Bacillus sp. FSL K6-3431]|uniref:GNAT family N-acetyltransferase n=1 Tax=Bacillus sp. FSL K6-3431 TaxID=2921500 RepID=UPI0030FCF965
MQKVVKVTTEQQLQDAFKVRMKVFVEEQNVPSELEIDDLEAEATHFVLYNDDRPGGAGRFRVVENIGKVERICVLKDDRKAGAGARIMNAIEEYASSLQLQSLKLNAQTSAIAFYERLGYKVISEEFMDAGIPHKTMIKPLIINKKNNHQSQV